MPTVPRRGTGYVARSVTPSVQPGNAFQPPEPIDIGPAARQVAQIVEQHRERADQLALLDADNQLSTISTQLETHTLSKHGKDALGAGAEVEDRFRQATSEIEAGLTNDRQRLNFRVRADQHWQTLNATVQRHGAQELEKYDAEQTDLGIKKRLESAVNTYSDAAVVGQSLAETKDLVRLYGERNGWSPEKIQGEQLTRTSQFHAQVISRMLAEGNDIQANDYYKRAKPEVNAEVGTTIEQHLEVALSEGAGFRAADDIWTRLGPKALNDPVRIATLEQEARDKYGDNPKVLKATIQELRSRAQAQNAEQQEVGASNKATILGAFAKGASLTSLVRRPEYLALSGTDQEQLKSYMLASQYNAANRELLLDTRADAAKTKTGFAKYWELSSPDRLASMSENQILALEPTLGRTLVGQLMTQKRSLTNKEGLLAATIDDDLFKSVADDAGLHPYDPKLDEGARASLGRLKNMTEAEIGRIQGQTGKQLTRDEKSKVMRSVIDQKVMIDMFGRDPERVASTVSKDDRGDAYIPIERVHPQFRTEALNWMRSNGLILEGESDKQALARFQRRIEKAYAARILGTTAAELDAILRGQQ